MLKLFDTSVVVAALTDPHPLHEAAHSQLKEVLQDNTQMAVSAHTLAETYSTLTVLQVRPRITPSQARRMVEENVVAVAEIVPLNAGDYESVLTRMADLGLVSGAIYDGLHVPAAEKIEADALLTCNGRDFRRMPPKDPTELVALRSRLEQAEREALEAWRHWRTALLGQDWPSPSVHSLQGTHSSRYSQTPTRYRGAMSTTSGR